MNKMAKTIGKTIFYSIFLLPVLAFPAYSQAGTEKTKL